MKALIVDDSKVVRSVIAKLLESINAEYKEAENGKVALARVSEETFDLIMLDWNMPEMDGMEFFKAANEKGLLVDTKVVFCTTESDIEKITAAISNGAAEYIMKPFNKEIFDEKLRMLGFIE